MADTNDQHNAQSAPDERVYPTNEEFLREMREHRQNPQEPVFRDGDVTYNITPQPAGITGWLIRTGVVSTTPQAWLVLAGGVIILVLLIWRFFF